MPCGVRASNCVAAALCNASFVRHAFDDTANLKPYCNNPGTFIFDSEKEIN